MLSDQFIASNKKLLSRQDHYIIAVSGGIDSVVLCELCHQAGHTFDMAHCNFQLRGDESDRDEAFVKKLGEKYQCRVHVKKFDTETYALKNRISIQEAARKLRYNWFKQLVSQFANDGTRLALLTAHHADDNIETILMNFFRGTGLHGLTGIPPVNDCIKRPLLAFTRKEIEEFAGENKLAWVEDSSNQSSKYTRNFFRNELIPSIENIFPGVKQNLQNNINRFIEIEKLYHSGIDLFRRKLFKQKGEEVHVPVKQLLGFNNNALVYELFAPFGFSEKQIPELVKLSEAESGKYTESADHQFRIIRHRHWFIISPVHSKESNHVVITKADKEIIFELGKLEIREITNSTLQTPNFIALLDSEQIEFPLLLRKLKTGDYFYPLGMKKRKRSAVS